MARYAFVPGCLAGHSRFRGCVVKVLCSLLAERFDIDKPGPYSIANIANIISEDHLPVDQTLFAVLFALLDVQDCGKTISLICRLMDADGKEILATDPDRFWEDLPETLGPLPLLIARQELVMRLPYFGDYFVVFEIDGVSVSEFPLRTVDSRIHIA